MDALTGLLAECSALGVLEPKAMVDRLVRDEALVAGAVRRHLPGSIREKPIQLRCPCNPLRFFVYLVMLTKHAASKLRVVSAHADLVRVKFTL